MAASQSRIHYCGPSRGYPRRSDGHRSDDTRFFLGQVSVDSRRAKPSRIRLLRESGAASRAADRADARRTRAADSSLGFSRRFRGGHAMSDRVAAPLTKGRMVATLLSLSAATIVIAIVAIAFGSGHISLARAVIDGSSPDRAILIGVRLPRILMGAIVGAALAGGGVALQALVRRPLAGGGIPRIPRG